MRVGLAGFGRAISEVGAVMIVGGNIDHLTRVMTTAIALETSKGDLSKAIRHDEVTLVMELSNEDDRYPVRRGACDFNISLMTDMEQAKLLCEAMAESPSLTIDAHEDYFGSSYKESTDKFIFKDAKQSGNSKAASA